MMFSLDYLMFMIPAFILMGFTSWYVKHAYSKWSKVRATSGLTGQQAAERLMSAGGLYGVRINTIAGQMTDHYDPRNKTLNLSQGVANQPSVAALAIAAHELGHAMQDADDYFPLRLRGALVPMVNIGSNLGWILIMIGLFINLTELAWLGVIFFAFGAVFALATLPVEFDASARAKRLLADSGIVNQGDELGGVKSVLNAAALTYVAALVTAILQILYYVTLIGRRRD
ncbi:MAG TPA: zinc metallopeptidase [Anaerolineales bacterium]|nr:zinc metallopeptidase [Anaerolineales bacterium]